MTNGVCIAAVAISPKSTPDTRGCAALGTRVEYGRMTPYSSVSESRRAMFCASEVSASTTVTTNY